MPGGGCRPRLYVYELPDTYRDAGQPTGRPGFPPTLAPEVTTDAWLADYPHRAVALRNSVSLQLGAVFFARALHHACRTLNPDDADLFFLPVYHRGFNGKHVCGEATPRKCARDGLLRRLQRLRNAANVSYVDARGGADHFVIVPHNGYWFDTRPTYELGVGDKWLGKTTYFCLETGASYEWPGAHTLRLFKGAPFASYVHAPAATPWRVLPWRTPHARRIGVAAAFAERRLTRSSRGPAAAQMAAVRLALSRSCRAAANVSEDACRFLSVDAKTNPDLVEGKAVRGSKRSRATDGIATGRSGRGPGATKPGATPLAVRVSRLYWSATFCLQPVGDACTRKGTMDALLLGCIPVLIHRCQLLQWPWHWGAWMRDATVFFELDDVVKKGVDVVAEVLAIPLARVDHMQRTIARHAHCMHYFVPEMGEGASGGGQSEGAHRASGVRGASDAFDVAVNGAWALSRGEDPANATLCVPRPLPAGWAPTPQRADRIGRVDTQ